jgi:hypothetical protein
VAYSYQLVVHAGEAWEWFPVAEGQQEEAFGFMCGKENRIGKILSAVGWPWECGDAMDSVPRSQLQTWTIRFGTMRLGYV